MMRARLNRDVCQFYHDACNRVVGRMGTEGDAEKLNGVFEFTYLFKISATNHIYVNREEFDYIEPLADLAELVERCE